MPQTEPWEILYLKAYKIQLPVIERALETAALMLGTDKSRGYCLEMICADFRGERDWKPARTMYGSWHLLGGSAFFPWRSRLGDDVEENLIRLCAGYHRDRYLLRRSRYERPRGRAAVPSCQPSPTNL